MSISSSRASTRVTRGIQSGDQSKDSSAHIRSDRCSVPNRPLGSVSPSGPFPSLAEYVAARYAEENFLSQKAEYEAAQKRDGFAGPPAGQDGATVPTLASAPAGQTSAELNASGAVPGGKSPDELAAEHAADHPPA